MLLDNISSPQDLRKLSPEQLPIVAEEIRKRIVEVVAQTGGHIASSLGAVELVIALHYCLDTPTDKIVWDVGHQSYAHKILTGRNKDFVTLRQYQGLSGFPSKNESVYDTFVTGHSSTAISSAMGLACARDYQNQSPRFKVAAIIGDGSLSGGLCFEGLNNAGHLQKDILVVLNTNEMSIAPNVGAISTYLNKVISLPVYNHFKGSLENFISSRLPKGSRLLKMALKFEEGIKGLFIPGVLFEELGFRYFGPLDGHDLNVLIPTLKNIIHIKGPRLLHVVTKKGKGYPPAEKDPVKFHGMGSFNIATGQSIKQEKPGPLTYTEAFSKKLTELAAKDDKIVAITAAMPEGTGLDRFRDAYPERFFDVGIAEAHAVCFAGGLASGGLKPVVAIYSTFLQRAYDQVIEDVCLQNLPVVLAVDRAGIVGEDGVTHQGLFDISFLSNIPNLVVMAPKDCLELEAMLEFAISLNKPVAVRYPRSACFSSNMPVKELALGKPEILQEGRDYVIIALGSMVMPCKEAVDLLAAEGFSGGLINARFASPLDAAMLQSISNKAKFIFTAEEGVIDGGFGSLVSQSLNRQVTKIGLLREFIPHGARDVLLAKYGLDSKGIAERIKSVICQK